MEDLRILPLSLSLSLRLDFVGGRGNDNVVDDVYVCMCACLSVFFSCIYMIACVRAEIPPL